MIIERTQVSLFITKPYGSVAFQRKYFMLETRYRDLVVDMPGKCHASLASQPKFVAFKNREWCIYEMDCFVLLLSSIGALICGAFEELAQDGDVI